jgi:hypothetical protein
MVTIKNPGITAFSKMANIHSGELVIHFYDYK